MTTHSTPQPSTPPWTTDAADPRRKSPGLACLLSIVPGLGQIYVGYYGLGFLHTIVVGVIFLIMATEPSEELMPAVALFFVFFMLYNIVDAGRRASLFNQALAGVPGVKMPEGVLTLPSFRLRGSIPGGVAIMIAGAILLTHTVWGLSLRWVEDWWPVAPIAFGAWLVLRAASDRGQ